MNRSLRCLALFAIAVGAWACKGDPESSLNRGTASTIRAFPNIVFVTAGETAEVFVDVRDDANQQVAQNAISFTPGPGIVVVWDSMFQPVFNPSGVLVAQTNPTRLRYEVTGVLTVGSSFTVSSTGQTIDIPVNVVPSGIPTAAISNINPALGEVVTISLTGTLIFDSTATVTTDPSTTQPVIVSTGTSTIDFLVAPNTDNAFTVTGVKMPYALSVPALSLTTDTAITSTAIAAVPVTLSSATPLAAGPLTVTLGSGFAFDPATAAVSFGFLGTVTEVPAWTTNVDPAGAFIDVIVPAGDGVTLNTVNVYGVQATAAAIFSLTLPTDQQLTQATCPVGLPGTDASATAPVLISPLPAQGVSTEVFDCGPTTPSAFFGFPGRWYSVDAGAGQNFDIVVNWSDDEDYGWYLDFYGIGCTADALGHDPNQPEAASCAGGAGILTGAFISFDAGNPLDLIVFGFRGQ